jgi:hypothetical protein
VVLRREGEVATETDSSRDSGGRLKLRVRKSLDQHVRALFGLPNNLVAVAVHRLRQRYGELVPEESAHAVDSRRDVEDEMRYLVKLLSAL